MTIFYMLLAVALLALYDDVKQGLQSALLDAFIIIITPLALVLRWLRKVLR